MSLVSWRLSQDCTGRLRSTATNHGRRLGSKMSDSGKQIGDCQHAKNPAWCVECLRQAVEERIADEKFVVRARQAFGIMMHRGWHAVRRNTGDWKIGEFLARDSEFLAWTRKHFFIDPFTCLIEADKWMVEREQSK